METNFHTITEGSVEDRKLGSRMEEWTEVVKGKERTKKKEEKTNDGTGMSRQGGLTSNDLV